MTVIRRTISPFQPAAALDLCNVGVNLADFVTLQESFTGQ